MNIDTPVMGSCYLLLMTSDILLKHTNVMNWWENVAHDQVSQPLIPVSFASRLSHSLWLIVWVHNGLLSQKLAVAKLGRKTSWNAHQAHQGMFCQKRKRWGGKPCHEKPTRVQSPTPHKASLRPCRSNPVHNVPTCHVWILIGRHHHHLHHLHREKGSKKEGKGIGGLWEDISVVEGSQADCHLLWHGQGWSHLQIPLIKIVPIVSIMMMMFTVWRQSMSGLVQSSMFR